ncbi:HAD family hydrolase [Saccharicrinis sp. GN24d3]|uniref:HAD family hydrolase n=1 Tax=Saccharicrinis sp. GN24d3 TaxID=3458416 RepID=UPI0040355721
MEIKAVIFDLDGTLIDSIEDIADANNQMLREHGYPTHELKEYVKWIGNGARRLVDASLPPLLRGKDTMLYLNKYSACYEKNICNKSTLFPKIDHVLNELTEMDIPFAINTNKPQHLTDIVVEEYFNTWTFRSVIGHSNVFPHKPDPKGALHFARQINCDPKHILFVGDSVVDMQTAQAAGMIPLGVSWGYGKPGMEGDNVPVIQQPEKILNYIKINIENYED